MADYVDPDLLEFAERAYAKFDESHDLKHALAVWKNVCDLIVVSKIDCSGSMRLLQYASILHDTYDHKYKHLCLPIDEIEEFIIAHLEKDAITCMRIIDNISWSKRDRAIPLAHDDHLRRLVQAADWIEALGETGLQRCIAYTRAKNPAFDDNQVRAEVKAHIREKLLKIQDELPFYAYKYVQDRQLNAPLEKYLLS